MSFIKREFKGEFITDKVLLQEKLQEVKAFIFDWDGVFNNGQKNSEYGSIFSEVDSMGTNLLRYSSYLKRGKMPVTAIISGEKNASAFYFSKRECFHSSYFKIPNKIVAFKHFCAEHDLKPNEVAYFFDDVLDLPIAEICGLRILVDQKANTNFLNYCHEFKMADYATAFKGGDHAVREACELLIGMNGNFNEVITTRKNYDKKYLDYIEQRKTTSTRFFTLKNGSINEENLT